ncbi:hypothetical protein IM295_05115 [Enterobacter cloacae complex sp. P14RS]|uniref:hypothetical protein n=1 Tax=Enterobacter TaxID=547 RepID=UPI0018674BA4|nr:MULTISPECIES: hypothetical protein [Enterobacter]MBE3480690.1 hypothetical protein [Enterobacter cloacae complex sp. P14RS]
MKEFNGTPGPWVVDVDGVDARWNIDSLGRVSVAITNQVANDKDWAVRDANTKLIAAAPDLLAALQLIISYHDDGKCELHHEDVEMARATISKALGEE